MQLYRIRIVVQKYYLFQTLQSFFADLFYLRCFEGALYECFIYLYCQVWMLCRLSK